MATNLGLTAGTCTDDYGHGTHIAGTIADTTYGFATSATVSCFKLLNSGGTVPSISGFFEAVAYALDSKNNVDVVNLSFGLRLTTDECPTCTPAQFDAVRDMLNSEIKDLSDNGIYSIMAAGNRAEDACIYTPQSATAEKAFTVQAYNEQGLSNSLSNFGTCTDLTAPGEDIPSLSFTGNNPAVLTGTSFAAPHVAAATAILLSGAAKVDVSTLTSTGIDITAGDGATIKALGISCI